MKNVYIHPKFTKQKIINIGLDVDGVLRNIVSSSIRAYLLNGGYKDIKYKDVKNYDFRKQFNIENFEDFFRHNAETVFLNAKPMPYTNEVKKLLQYGNIQIITSQYKGLENLTLKWLDRYEIPYDEIYFTWDKSSVKTDILLDDFPKNLYSMPSDVIKVCYDCPYNKKWPGLRVKNMKEFVGLINKLAKGIPSTSYSLCKGNRG